MQRERTRAQASKRASEQASQADRQGNRHDRDKATNKTCRTELQYDGCKGKCTGANYRYSHRNQTDKVTRHAQSTTSTVCLCAHVAFEQMCVCARVYCVRCVPRAVTHSESKRVPGGAERDKQVISNTANDASKVKHGNSSSKSSTLSMRCACTQKCCAAGAALVLVLLLIPPLPLPPPPPPPHLCSFPAPLQFPSVDNAATQHTPERNTCQSLCYQVSADKSADTSICCANSDHDHALCRGPCPCHHVGRALCRGP